MRLEAANRLLSKSLVEASVKSSFKTFVTVVAACAKAYTELTLAGREDRSQVLDKRKAREAARKALVAAGSALEADLVSSMKEAGFAKVKPVGLKISKVSMLGWFGAHYGAEIAPKVGVTIYVKYNENAVMAGDPVITGFVCVKGKVVAKYSSKPAKVYKDLPKVVKPQDIFKALSPALTSLENSGYKDLK